MRAGSTNHVPCSGQCAYLRVEVTSKGARCLSPTAAAWCGGLADAPHRAPPRRGPLGQVVAPAEPEQESIPSPPLGTWERAGGGCFWRFSFQGTLPAHAP